MESFINKIIEIDKLADERLKQSAQKKKELLADAEKECAELAKKLMTDADKRIEEVEEFNRADCDLKIAELEKHYEEENMSIDEVFSDVHLLMIEDIYNQTVGDQVD